MHFNYILTFSLYSQTLIFHTALRDIKKARQLWKICASNTLTNNVSISMLLILFFAFIFILLKNNEMKTQWGDQGSWIGSLFTNQTYCIVCLSDNLLFFKKIHLRKLKFLQNIHFCLKNTAISRGPNFGMRCCTQELFVGLTNICTAHSRSLLQLAQNNTFISIMSQGLYKVMLHH